MLRWKDVYLRICFITLQEGKGLVDNDHYAKTDIQKRIEELELSWEALMAASAEKKDRLQDAYQVCLP